MLHHEQGNLKSHLPYCIPNKYRIILPDISSPNLASHYENYEIRTFGCFSQVLVFWNQSHATCFDPLPTLDSPSLNSDASKGSS
jgi:hypothetical protein